MRFQVFCHKRNFKRKYSRAFTLTEMLISTGISMILMTGLLMAVYDIGRYSKRVTLLIYTQRETNHAIQVITQNIMSGSEVKFFNPDYTPYIRLDLPEDGVYDDKSSSGGIDWTNVRNRDGLAIRIDLNTPPTPLEGDDSWQGIFYDETNKMLIFLQNISVPSTFEVLANNVERDTSVKPVFNVPNVGIQNDLVAVIYQVLIVGYVKPTVTEFLQGSFTVRINTAVKLRNTRNI